MNGVAEQAMILFTNETKTLVSVQKKWINRQQYPSFFIFIYLEIIYFISLIKHNANILRGKGDNILASERIINKYWNSIHAIEDSLIEMHSSLRWLLIK